MNGGSTERFGMSNEDEQAKKHRYGILTTCTVYSIYGEARMEGQAVLSHPNLSISGSAGSWTQNCLRIPTLKTVSWFMGTVHISHFCTIYTLVVSCEPSLSDRKTFVIAVLSRSERYIIYTSQKRP